MLIITLKINYINIFKNNLQKKTKKKIKSLFLNGNRAEEINKLIELFMNTVQNIQYKNY